MLSELATRAEKSTTAQERIAAQAEYSAHLSQLRRITAEEGQDDPMADGRVRARRISLERNGMAKEPQVQTTVKGKRNLEELFSAGQAHPGLGTVLDRQI